MKSSVHKDRQFELDALGRSKPVESGDSICNMLRATETGSRPSCRVDDGLKTVKQAGRKTSQCRTTVVQSRQDQGNDQRLIHRRRDMVPLAHLTPSHPEHPEQHLDRFSRFCRAHDSDRPTDRQTMLYSVSNNRSHMYVRSSLLRRPPSRRRKPP